MILIHLKHVTRSRSCGCAKKGGGGGGGGMGLLDPPGVMHWWICGGGGGVDVPSGKSWIRHSDHHETEY